MNVNVEGRIDLSVLKHVERDDGARIERGDVLFNNTNSPDLVGKTAYFNREGNWAYSNHMTRLRPSRAIDARFLAVQLHWLWMKGFYKSVMNHHVNQASVATKTLLARVEILVRRAAEQERIVAAIEEHLSRLDAACATLEVATKRLRALRGTVLTIRLEAIDSVPRVALADIAEFVTDGDHRPPKRTNEGIPHLTAKHIKRGGISLDDCTYVSAEGFEQTRKRYEPREGDVIVTCVGTIGETAVVPPELVFSADRNLAAIRLLPEVAEPNFVRLALTTPTIRHRMFDASGSTAQPHLYLRDLRVMTVPLPSLAEQRRIAADVEQQLSAIDAMDRAVEQATRRGAGLRRSVLESAFRGKLVPLDPSDEPASMLLERIAAERAVAPKKTRRREERTPA